MRAVAVASHVLRLHLYFFTVHEFYSGHCAKTRVCSIIENMYLLFTVTVIQRNQESDCRLQILWNMNLYDIRFPAEGAQSVIKT